jgi:hypothetical protein
MIFFKIIILLLHSLGLTHDYLTRLEKPAKSKHFSLFGPFVSYEENKEL